MANVSNDIQFQRIPERRFRYADIVNKPNHVPVITRIMGDCFVMQCPKDTHDEGYDTHVYKAWYQREYRRISRVLAKQGNAQAKRAIKNEQARKNKWAQKQRDLKRIPPDALDYLLASNGDVVGNAGEEHNLD